MELNYRPDLVDGFELNTPVAVLDVDEGPLQLSARVVERTESIPVRIDDVAFVNGPLHWRVAYLMLGGARVLGTLELRKAVERALLVLAPTLLLGTKMDLNLRIAHPALSAILSHLPRLGLFLTHVLPLFLTSFQSAHLLRLCSHQPLLALPAAHRRNRFQSLWICLV